MMRTPLVRWLSLRVRVLLGFVFLFGALLPPYVPASALTDESDELPSQQFLFVEEGFLMKTTSLGDQGTRLAYGEGLIHETKDGDTVDSIAKRYGVQPDTVRWANGIQGNSVRAGIELLILPVDGVMHVVRRGQTLSRIAQLYDVSEDAISDQNKIQGGFIVAGQQLIIPGGKPITGVSAIASADQVLQFADRLPSGEIRLQLNVTGGARGTPAIAPAISAVLSQTLLQRPCENCFYTQKFGPGHYAVDIQTRGGGPIFAAEDGTVTRAETGWNGGYGSVIEVDHGNGLITLYAHNKELYVKEGDAVKRGQVIAAMGNTGLVHGPTGIHIHFEVLVNGVKRNPILYLE